MTTTNTPAFDLNAFVSAFIGAIVEQAIAPMKQEIVKMSCRLDLLEERFNQHLMVGVHRGENPAATTAIPSTGATEQRVDALFTLLSTLIDTSDDAIEVAKQGNFDPTTKLQNYVVAETEVAAERIAENVLDAHNDTYDHDDFISDYSDIEDQVRETAEEVVNDNIKDTVKEVIRSASVSIDF